LIHPCGANYCVLVRRNLILLIEWKLSIRFLKLYVFSVLKPRVALPTVVGHSPTAMSEKNTLRSRQTMCSIGPFLRTTHRLYVLCSESLRFSHWILLTIITVKRPTRWFYWISRLFFLNFPILLYYCRFRESCPKANLLCCSPQK